LAHPSEPVEAFVRRVDAVLESERDRPFDALDHGHRRAAAGSDRLLDGACVAQGRAHQQEPRVVHRQQRELPGHAAVAITVEMELIHDHAREGGLDAVAQRELG
jgi:hypothetical protein